MTVHNARIKTIMDHIRQLGYKHNAWQVFSDFCELSALSISNAVDQVHYEEREKQYLELVKRYDKKELDLFPQMLASLIDVLQEHAESHYPEDVLGQIFHELELHNKWKGQFFTPTHVCDMMGRISLSEDDQTIAEQGYITVCEPCVGSGAMVLGLAKALTDNKFNYCKHMVVTATDVDLKCVHMAYLQFSLYGIPAVVIHGNTLSMEEWSRWYTPVYLMDGWIWRQACGNKDKRYPEDEAIKRATEPLYAVIRDAEIANDSPAPTPLSAESANETPKIANDDFIFDTALKEGKNGQLSLF